MRDRYRTLEVPDSASSCHNTAMPRSSDIPRWARAWGSDEGRERAWNLLRDTFGADAHKELSAPGMVNVIGDHTDYNHGLALPTVLRHRAYVAARPRRDNQVRVAYEGADAGAGAPAVWFGDLDNLVPGAVSGWPARIASVFWALLERGYSGGGMDIAIASCVPARMGMSSSTAASAATALVADELWGLALDTEDGRRELAEACVDGEQAFVGDPDGGAPTGGIDFHTVLRCAPGDAVLLDFATPSPSVLSIPLYFPEYGLSLMLIDTRVRPESNAGISSARRAECQAAAESLGVPSLRELEERPTALQEIAHLDDPVLMRRARHVFHENERVRLVFGELSGTGPAHERFVAVGKAMYRAHASLDLDFEISSDLLNMTVDSVFQEGALGAHLTGWGRGGAVLALVRKTEAERIAAALDEVYASRGLEPPHYALL